MENLDAGHAGFILGEAGTSNQRARYLNILNATLAILGESGYSQTTMESIAARSGVGLGTIYKHFKSRDKLLYVATDAWIRREALGARDRRTDMTLREQVFHSIQDSAERMIAEPNLLRGWVTANLSTDQDVVKLASSRNFIGELNAVTFQGHHQPQLQESLTAVMENFFFGALVRWGLGQRSWDQLLADVTTAVSVVFDAHSESVDSSAEDQGN